MQCVAIVELVYQSKKAGKKRCQNRSVNYNKSDYKLLQQQLTELD